MKVPEIFHKFSKENGQKEGVVQDMTHKKGRQRREKSKGSKVLGKLYTAGNSTVHITAVTE